MDVRIERELDLVFLFDDRRSLGGFAVELDQAFIAGGLGDGACLGESELVQKLVDSHVVLS